MADSFGTRLRQQREQKQISLRSISEQSKIGMALLEGLERDDLTHWPGGIFRRAFIRSYAQHIGLDPDTVSRELLQLFPDPAEVSPTPQAFSAAADLLATPSARLRYFLESALESLSLRRRAPDAVRVVDAAPVPTESPVGEEHMEDVPPPYTPMPNLAAAAELCTELSRLSEPQDTAPALQRVAKMLDAVGVVIWVWDRRRTELRPWATHGYSAQVLAQLPRVRRDAENATAAAFRSMETRVVRGSELACGALAIPLMTSIGCIGVFAVELSKGREGTGPVLALATIFAAQLASMIGTVQLVAASSASDSVPKIRRRSKTI
jgi:transcriptional regulator with XRE-family HTH domain